MPKSGRRYICVDLNFWKDILDAGLTIECGTLFQLLCMESYDRDLDGRITLRAIERLAAGLIEPNEAIAGLCRHHFIEADSEAEAFTITAFEDWFGEANRKHRAKQEAGRKGGLASGKTRRSRSNQQSILEAGASGLLQQEETRREEKREKIPASPSAPLVDPLLGFEEFWNVYPSRNGRKVGKDKAAQLWKKLSTEDRGDAHRGAANLRRDVDSGVFTPIKDPERFIRDRVWVAYLTPLDLIAAMGPAAYAPTTSTPTGGLDLESDAFDVFAGHRR